jgi:hypothetical protein
MRGCVCNSLVPFGVSLMSKSSRTPERTYCLVCDSSNLEGQGPQFISPGDMVAQLYPRTLGSHSVTGTRSSIVTTEAASTSASTNAKNRIISGRHI